MLWKARFAGRTLFEPCPQSTHSFAQCKGELRRVNPYASVVESGEEIQTAIAIAQAGLNAELWAALLTP